MASIPFRGPMVNDISDLPPNSTKRVKFGGTAYQPAVPTLVVRHPTLDIAPIPSPIEAACSDGLAPPTNAFAPLSFLCPGVGPEAEEIEGNIEQEDSLHMGGYADVFRGKWTTPSGKVLPVAIKRLRSVKMSAQNSKDPNKTANLLNKRLLREVWTWEKLVHPNITPLLGYRSGETPVLITPYYENGNLAQYLEHNQQAPRLRLLVQAAAGLEYLHECSPIIVHGDIKPDNVLVNDFGDAALCDFGLAHTLLEMRTGLTTSGLGQGCLGFIAPEIIAAEGHKNICRTTMSDVYAVGGLILNVLSDRIPFYHLPPMRVMMMVYQGDMPPRCQHPEIDPRATIWELMESCWQHDPQRRPDMGQVCLQLHGEEAYFSREGRLRRHGDHQGSTMVGVQHPNNSSPTISGPFLSDSTMDLIAGDSGGDSETEGEGSGSETSDDGDDVTTELRIPKGSEERS